MGYLQSGVCFKSKSDAITDFVSRIDDYQARVDAINTFGSFSDSQIAAFFPDCLPFSEISSALFSQSLLVVCLLIGITYIKKAGYL